MSRITAPKGGASRTVLIVMALLLVIGGGVGAYFLLAPKPVDPRLATTTADTVPIAGLAPFDPKPLMDKVAERIKTDKFRFVVLGDSKHADTLPAFIKFLEETIKPDFVLTTGDMVKGGGGKVGPGYYELLTQEAGQSMRKLPWWPAIGNHELAGNPVIPGKTEADQMKVNQVSGMDNFKKFYNLPDDHYVIEFRNCVFIALPFSNTVMQMNFGWLAMELQKASEAKKHIFVFNHRPFFTVGSKKEDDVPNKETPVTTLLKNYGVKAVFSGHDHGYYRTVRNGIPYFISAGGGAKIYESKRASEALPEDVWYYADPNTGKYVLHKGGSPDVVTTEPTQFLIAVDVDGDKINCSTWSVKNEKWDEVQVSK